MENARKQYEDALDYSDVASVSQHQAEIITSTHLNLALVLIKQQNYKEAIEHCTKTFTYSPDNVKAFFRRGKAYFESEQLDLATKDF